MKRTFTHSITFITALSALFIMGCGNPADDVTPAEVKPADENAADAPPVVVDTKAYTLDATSKIDFIGSKVTGKHEGGFKTFDGSLAVVDGKLIQGSSITIDMTSTWSDAEKLTAHLKSPDFFDVEKFPKTTFVISGVESGADGKTTITGNLTLHGVTKSISFPADIAVADDTLSLKAEFSLKRFDFDIKYPGKKDDLIREEVVIKLDVSASK